MFEDGDGALKAVGPYPAQVMSGTARLAQRQGGGVMAKAETMRSFEAEFQRRTGKHPDDATTKEIRVVILELAEGDEMDTQHASDLLAQLKGRTADDEPAPEGTAPEPDEEPAPAKVTVASIPPSGMASSRRLADRGRTCSITGWATRWQKHSGQGNSRPSSTMSLATPPWRR